MSMDKIEGFLEVGYNESGEVVVNHPDLKPDDNGVGHIVFSPNQARNLAELLRKHATLAENNIREKREAEARKKAESIPVDRSSRQLIGGGDPNSDEHREINPETGQQRDYVVLSAAERAKGFVRPVRLSYIHIGQRIEGANYVVITPELARKIRENGGCASLTSMSHQIAETYARYLGFYSGTFCTTCRKHRPLEEFVWVGTNKQVGS